MSSSPVIAYPGGISPQLAGNLSAAASGADTFASKVDTGLGTLTDATSDVSVVMNEINTHEQGRAITALAGFWDGKGAIGSGGLGTGGVISDASKAIMFLPSLSGSMPGVSGGINDQLPAIKSGLAAIATVEANPHKTWTVSEASSLQASINSMVSALTALNTTLLNTASALESSASSAKLAPGAPCASGVALGDGPGNWDGGFTQEDLAWLKGNNIDPEGTGTGNGGNGGGGDPPDGGDPPNGSDEGSPDDPNSRIGKFLKAVPRFIKKNSLVALGVGTFNSAPYAVKDLTQGKNPLADSGFWQLYIANVAQGYAAAPVLRSAKGLVALLGFADTDGNTAIAQSLLGSGMIGDGIVATPWLIKQLKDVWKYLEAPSPKGHTPVTPTPKPSLSPAK